MKQYSSTQQLIGAMRGGEKDPLMKEAMDERTLNNAMALCVEMYEKINEVQFVCLVDNFCDPIR